MSNPIKADYEHFGEIADNWIPHSAVILVTTGSRSLPENRAVAKLVKRTHHMGKDDFCSPYRS